MQLTRRHACRGPLEVGQGAQLSAAGPDGCNEAAVVEALECHLDQADEAQVRFWKLERCSQMLPQRSEEHTSELQSLMRISYAVFCLKKKKKTRYIITSDI